jgi:hypothetical protein
MPPLGPNPMKSGHVRTDASRDPTSVPSSFSPVLLPSGATFRRIPLMHLTALESLRCRWPCVPSMSRKTQAGGCGFASGVGRKSGIRRHRALEWYGPTAGAVAAGPVGSCVRRHRVIVGGRQGACACGRALPNPLSRSGPSGVRSAVGGVDFGVELVFASEARGIFWRQ